MGSAGLLSCAGGGGGCVRREAVHGGVGRKGLGKGGMHCLYGGRGRGVLKGEAVHSRVAGRLGKHGVGRCHECHEGRSGRHVSTHCLGGLRGGCIGVGR